MEYTRAHNLEAAIAECITGVLRERPSDPVRSLGEKLVTLQPKAFRPVVVCGPSGVGKGTLLDMLLQCHDADFGFCVSHTSRNPRPGEVDSVAYHFASVDEMERMIAAGEFIEYARVHGNIYGTSKAAVRAVQASGKTCVLDIDIQGHVASRTLQHVALTSSLSDRQAHSPSRRLI